MTQHKVKRKNKHNSSSGSWSTTETTMHSISGHQMLNAVVAKRLLVLNDGSCVSTFLLYCSATYSGSYWLKNQVFFCKSWPHHVSKWTCTLTGKCAVNHQSLACGWAARTTACCHIHCFAVVQIVKLETLISGNGWHNGSYLHLLYCLWRKPVRWLLLDSNQTNI